MPSTRFRRIAIINRGEPALRLIRAARELREEVDWPLVTIALYTDPDEDSLFVQAADEVYHLGPALALDRNGQLVSSYLDYARLQAALADVEADAVWVGWGFVAEHAAFADLCARLGVVFIGPNGDVMRALGDKIGSKRLAEEAGVPVAAWSKGPVTTVEEALAWAERLGYPLLVKATAGGGGRGIRKVRAPEELAEAFERSQSEALKAFGDDTVFLESLVTGARHIEVQILADEHGTTWAAGVRDCSLQRRNQKVVEEAPSACLPKETEGAIREAAVRLAQKAGYVNAGTVELLYQPDKNAFYFMEMNTRLQVEHPVTEVTTGLDLVKWQLAIAAGERLPPSPPPTQGHAIEVRLCAEDPDAGFAPSPGRVVLFRPAAGPGVRIDSGVGEGDVIPDVFDSMVAKIIAFGRNRSEALARLSRALSETQVAIAGGATNKPFLLEIINHSDVRAGRYDITWLDGYAAARDPGARPHADVAMLVTAIECHHRQHKADCDAFIREAGRGRPRMSAELGSKVALRHEGQSYSFYVLRQGRERYRVDVDDVRFDLHVERRGELTRLVRLEGVGYTALLQEQGAGYLVEVDGLPHRILRDEGGVIRAPAPAMVLSFQVAPGQMVERGQRVALLEAMKMEMWVTAPSAGRVKSIFVTPNTQVLAGAPLLAMESDQGEALESTGGRVQFHASARAKSLRKRSAVSAYLAWLDDVAACTLGYDLEASAISAQRPPLPDDLSAEDEDPVAAREETVIRTFTNIISVFKRLPDWAEENVRSPRDFLDAWLRALDRGGDGLPAFFAPQVRAAVAHYGITELENTPALQEALLYMHRTNKRAEQLAEPILALLERRLTRPEFAWAVRSQSFRTLLDDLVEATRYRLTRLCDAAKNARLRLYDLPVWEKAQARVYQELDGVMAQLLANGLGESARGALVDRLVTSPQPIVGYLARWMDSRDPAVHRLLLELQVRRFYASHYLRDLTLQAEDGVTSAQASVQLDSEEYQLHAALCQRPQLETALLALYDRTRVDDSADPVVWDLFITRSAATSDESDDALAELLRAALAGLPANHRPERVCFAFASPTERLGRYFTFEVWTDLVTEVREMRRMHPMWAKRLELGRLSSFDLEPLQAPSDVYLFHATAPQNPKDERLFALVDVRDSTPRPNPSGQGLEIPHLEFMFHQALGAMRAFQQRRPPHRRLHWNRITLFLWPELPVPTPELMPIVNRLVAEASQMGLEKVVLRVRSGPEASANALDRSLHYALSLDRVGRMRAGHPSQQPIRTLTPYQQRVLRLRARGITDPYEIIRWLTPSDTAHGSPFPRGVFLEHDLDERGRLVPVYRSYGENQANLVVGLITNFVDAVPEGMQRVMILGDPSREMGSLAEPECKRIIAALDLAQDMGVPVDWYPVSAGAKISLESGTENLDWTARVVRRIVELTQAGGHIHVVVAGVNVGAQSYWNAEATMLMHCKGVLVLTPDGSMVLTGKRALELSGGVSGEDNQSIGGIEVMGQNGQAQYVARNLTEACQMLLRHHELTYVAPGERFPRRLTTTDPIERDVCLSPHGVAGRQSDFATLGEIFDPATNPGRKRAFDIRSVMRAVADGDHAPLERWQAWRDAEIAVVWETRLGGHPVCLLGIESRPLPRFGFVPLDGSEVWNAGTLFPLASKKVARAINAASGNRPVVVLANLSGFDGSPESMQRLQLEYGAEIGRAVVNFDGPLIFSVISRYHGGAYVVFSATLNERLEVSALEGSYASVIGGAPAAAVVLTRDVDEKVFGDAEVKALQKAVSEASGADKTRLKGLLEKRLATVRSQALGEVAEFFDRTHSVQRAQDVGSIHHILPPSKLRPYLVSAVERGIAATLAARGRPRLRRAPGA